MPDASWGADDRQPEGTRNRRATHIERGSPIVADPTVVGGGDALPVGTQLGPYEITARIGAGGMGVVYRARDTKLGREVAIKVLPPTFVRDADRVARFAREARLLAALNHPRIASIYGVEDSGGTRALV